MKLLLILLGAAIGTLATAYFQPVCEPCLELNKEALFALEFIHKDTLLQEYMLNPCERERTRRGKEMFDRKFPK